MHKLRFSTHRLICSGFSLIEMSIVMIIIALISAMGITAGVEMIESARKASTLKKLDAIEEALMNFRAINDRIPCPANVALDNTATNYGIEGTVSGGRYTPATSINATIYNCVTTGSATAATANYYWGGQTPATPAPAQIAEGAVPVRTLDLPDDFAYDGWGNKFTYAVDAYATIPNAFNTMRHSNVCYVQVYDDEVDAGGPDGDPDTTGSARTTGAVYVLLSHGPSPHGARRNSTTSANEGSTDQSELRNCHCNSSATSNTYTEAF